MTDKGGLPNSLDISKPHHEARRSLARRLLTGAVACLLLRQAFLKINYLSASDFQGCKKVTGSSDFVNWSDIEATKELIWHNCDQDEKNFHCARLAVPLDYFNGTTDAHIALALIKIPASIPVTDERYGGAILFNPGGPGGSGVNFLQRNRDRLTSIIEGSSMDDSRKRYDLISFDPRGVELSEPKIQCFDSPAQRFAWDLRIMEEGILGSSDAAFGRLWSMSSAFSGHCSLSALEDALDIKRFVSTASVATDMLTIVDQHGQWREAEARRIIGTASSQDIPAEHRYKPGTEALQYWGFSYGTYLGMTFASMYPDRVGRLIVDGVVDADDYDKALWVDNLADTEREMHSFYDYCAKAGYPRCVLAKAEGNATSRQVEDRVRNITDSLWHNPLPVLEPYAEVITYSDIRNLIFAGLYTPITSFPLIADTLLGIENGNGTLMAKQLQPFHQFPDNSHSQSIRPMNKSALSLDHSATTAIACSDGDSQAFVTRDMFREHWQNLTTRSPTIGPQWALFRGNCIHYSVRAMHRFVGPWVGNTSFPLLFIGNSLDPVTPVRNARKMVQGYKDAQVVEQGCSGHCSVSARSSCTEKIINEYFQLGKLPEEKDVFCEADEVPFSSKQADTADLTGSFARHVRGGFSQILMPLM